MQRMGGAQAAKHWERSDLRSVSWPVEKSVTRPPASPFPHLWSRLRRAGRDLLDVGARTVQRDRRLLTSRSGFVSVFGATFRLRLRAFSDGVLFLCSFALFGASFGMGPGGVAGLIRWRFGTARFLLLGASFGLSIGRWFDLLALAWGSLLRRHG